ncbi:hypothetical protein F5884DRAFT_218005 [Xylogone sp. PMI_703]|nr:hypothetical protein F5884DRAFT_218005 [Xylogone sp. PMI_703]
MSGRSSSQRSSAPHTQNVPSTPGSLSKIAVVLDSESRQRRGRSTPSSAPDLGTQSTVKRGRPRKLLNVIDGVSLPVHGGRPLSAPRNASSVDRIPKRRGRPPAKPGQGTTQNQVKTKRGRRTGQKSEDGAKPGPKKRGRPPSKLSKLIEIQLSEPKYNPFLCEWRGCVAELQNLETLRRHIAVVHGKKQDSELYCCLWGRCGRHAKREVEDNGGQGIMDENEFWTEDDWREHVNVEHLIPFSWHMGDGPKGTSLCSATKLRGEQPMKWLFDSEGRQVTPSVNGQLIEEGDARENNRMRFVWKRVGVDYILVPRDTEETAAL